MRPSPTAPGYPGTGREERVKTMGPPDRTEPRGMFSFSPPYFSPRRGRQEPTPAEKFRSRSGGNDPYGTAPTSSPTTAAGYGWGESGRGRGLMAVHFLVLSSLALFSLDVILGIDRVLKLSLDHDRPRSWQPVTSLLMHGDQYHLMSNMFILMIFGKMAEEDMGAIGMLLSFVICGVVSSLVSLSLMPRDVYSCGASGAVFGLFSVCVLGKMFNLEKGAVPEVRLRELVETAVFGWFVASSVMAELRMVANGGVRGTDHAAHFGGVFAGAALILLARRSITRDSSGNRR
ncbi:unnamed protein product [Ascophyllum nodosum]